MKENNTGNYIIEVFPEVKFPEWDEFIKSSPQYSCFSASFWLRAISEATGGEFKIIGCYDNGRLAGGCALYLTRMPEGKAAKFPPLTKYNGLVLLQRDSNYPYKEELMAHGIMNAIIDYLEKNFDYVILINHPGLIDVRPFIWRGWDTQVKYTYIVDLQERFFISRDIERRAKIAQDSGIYIEESYDPHIFYDLWLKSFRRHKRNPPLDRANLLRLFNTLQERNALKMFVARNKENAAVASNVYIEDKNILFYWVAAFDPAYSGSGANQYLIKYTLEKFRDKFLSIDFVGADTPTIARYKATFGGRLVAHYQISKAIGLRAKSISFMKRAYRSFRPFAP